MKIHSLPSWIEKGQMVLVEDHVTNVVRDIQAMGEGRIDVYWNEQDEVFDLVERCLDGNQRLIFSTPILDQTAVDRLHRADHWYGNDVPSHVRPEGEDFVAEVDAANEAEERRLWELSRGKIREAGEEIAWALDNTSDRSSVGGSIRVPRSIDG